jgi:hypothetical protein
MRAEDKTTWKSLRMSPNLCISISIQQSNPPIWYRFVTALSVLTISMTDSCQQNDDKPIYTLAEGRPAGDPTSQTIMRGNPLKGGGLALLSDTQLIETLAHFPRERIPERYVFRTVILETYIDII